MVAEGVDVVGNLLNDILVNYDCFENAFEALILTKCCLTFKSKSWSILILKNERIVYLRHANPQGYGGFFIHLSTEKEITLNHTPK